MALSQNARRLYDALPTDGTKVGGITLQRELKLSKREYQEARDELKDEGLVVSGRGRGGSLARVEGKEPQKETTQIERMAHAREAKAAQSRERKELTHKRELILAYMRKRFPQVELKDVTFYGSDWQPIITVWNKDGSGGVNYTVDYERVREEMSDAI